MTKVGYFHCSACTSKIGHTKLVAHKNKLFLLGSTMINSRHENIPVRIALSLRQQAEEIARQQNTSLNHWITQALEEKILRMSDRNKILRMHDRSQEQPSESLRSAG